MNYLTMCEHAGRLGAITFNDEGAGSLEATSGKKTPAKIKYREEDGTETIKRMVIGTPLQLQSGDGWGGRALFHPLQETVGDTESHVIEYLRTHYNINLNHMTVLAICAILYAAKSPDAKATDPKLLNILSRFPKVDDKALDNITELFSKLKFSDSKSCLARIYLKKGAVLDGKRYNVLGTVTFPFYQRLLEEKSPEEYLQSICGKKFRKMDTDILKNAFHVLFTNIDTPELYSEGVLNVEAPFFESLLRTLFNVYKNIIEVFQTKDVLDNETLAKIQPFLNSFHALKDLVDHEDFRTKLVKESKRIPHVPDPRVNKIGQSIKTTEKATPVSTNERWGEIETTSPQPQPTKQPKKEETSMGQKRLSMYDEILLQQAQATAQHQEGYIKTATVTPGVARPQPVPVKPKEPEPVVTRAPHPVVPTTVINPHQPQPQQLYYQEPQAQMVLGADGQYYEVRPVNPHQVAQPVTHPALAGSVVNPAYQQATTPPWVAPQYQPSGGYYGVHSQANINPIHRATKSPRTHGSVNNPNANYTGVSYNTAPTSGLSPIFKHRKR